MKTNTMNKPNNMTTPNDSETTAPKALSDARCSPFLGKPKHLGNVANQVRSLGLNVGDTIIGREYYYLGGWGEVKLTLLFLGKEVAVFDYFMRNSHDQTLWYYQGETGKFTLNNREWSYF